MIRIGVSLLISFWVIVPAATAHHSAAAFFDEENMGEIQGEVTGIRWKNPHVAIMVTVTGADGEKVEWDVESNALNALDRIGISRETVAIGDQIRFFGPLSRHGLPLMRAYNILLPSGEEVVMMPHVSTERRWEDHSLVSAVPVLENRDVSDAIRQADGIFRVWTQGRISLRNAQLPLTAEAVAAKAAFDPLTDDPALKCIPSGMPAVMDVTFPVEFVDQGEEIVLRLEQWDTVRIIHMNGFPAMADGQPGTRVGYSVGHWDGGSLVVETSNIDWNFFDDRGTPLSNAVSVVERFTVSDDEISLHWEATTTDPATFTEPVVQEQTFRWVPGEEIKPYECTVGG